MKKLILALALLAALASPGADDTPNSPIELAPGAAKAPPLLTLASDPVQVLRACRAMLPTRPVEIRGSIILRNRKGIVASEHDYLLVMRHDADAALMTIRLFPRGETNETASVTISRRGSERPVIRMTRTGAETQVVASPLERVLDTDVTWLDLTFDFLWWEQAVYETEREGESVHGQKCSLILVKPTTPITGLSAVRLWVDRKTGCLMQAEQVGAEGKPIRRLWGTRVKKFDGKWMVSVLEVETLGSRHRTKITVDGLKEL